MLKVWRCSTKNADWLISGRPTKELCEQKENIRDWKIILMLLKDFMTSNWRGSPPSALNMRRYKPSGLVGKLTGSYVPSLIERAHTLNIFLHLLSSTFLLDYRALKQNGKYSWHSPNSAGWSADLHLAKWNRSILVTLTKCETTSIFCYN